DRTSLPAAHTAPLPPNLLRKVRLSTLPTAVQPAAGPRPPIPSSAPGSTRHRRNHLVAQRLRQPTQTTLRRGTLLLLVLLQRHPHILLPVLQQTVHQHRQLVRRRRYGTPATQPALHPLVEPRQRRLRPARRLRRQPQRLCQAVLPLP